MATFRYPHLPFPTADREPYYGSVSCKFGDFQDDNNPLNGTVVDSQSALFELLESFRGRQPFLFELREDPGFTLTIAFSCECGCVQHARSDGEPTYEMAVRPDPSKYGHASPVGLHGYRERTARPWVAIEPPTRCRVIVPLLPIIIEKPPYRKPDSRGPDGQPGYDSTPYDSRSPALISGDRTRNLRRDSRRTSSHWRQASRDSFPPVYCPFLDWITCCARASWSDVPRKATALCGLNGNTRCI